MSFKTLYLLLGIADVLITYILQLSIFLKNERKVGAVYKLKKLI